MNLIFFIKIYNITYTFSNFYLDKNNKGYNTKSLKYEK